MEHTINVYLLNTEFEVVKAITTFQSFIWNDRYQEAGDFELYIPAWIDNVNDYKIGYYVSFYIPNLYGKTIEAMPADSERLMIIEKVEIKDSVTDGAFLIITGRSLESILTRRIVWGRASFSGSIQSGVKTLIDANLVNPSDENRRIESFEAIISNNPAITNLPFISAQYIGDGLYSVVQSLAKRFDMGFTVYRATLNQQDGPKTIFSFYKGKDRSYEQQENTFVTFSKDFDNLLSSNYKEDTTNYRNVALVAGIEITENGERKYTDVNSAYYSGMSRYESFIDAKDLNQTKDSKLVKMESISGQNGAYVFTYSGDFVDLFQSGQTVSLHLHWRYENSEYETDVLSCGTISSISGNALSINLSFTIPELGALDSGSYLWIPSNKNIGNEKGEVAIPDDEYENVLKTKGNSELAKSTIKTEATAEISTMSQYVLGQDYFLGDYVQVEMASGISSRAQVTGIVTKFDDQGLSIYPDFSIDITSKLPEEYQKVEYIEVNVPLYSGDLITGSYCIVDTGLDGISSNHTAICEFQFVELPTGKESCIFSAYGGPTKGWQCSAKSDGTFMTDRGVAYTPGTPTVTTQKYIAYAGGSDREQADNPLTLFAQKEGANINHGNGHKRITKCLVKDNENPLAYLYACYRKSDRRPGFYDTVRHAFFEAIINGSDVTVTVGPDI